MAKKDVSEENRAIARRMAATFGGTPRVQNFLDEDEKSSIDILICADRPEEGSYSFGTIGLSDCPVPERLIDPALGAEIVGISTEEEFANVLATACFAVINEGWIAEPGRVFPGIVSMHIEDVTVPNLMFVEPFRWEDDLKSQPMKTKTVAWVLGLPITDEEMEFVREHGAEALEDKLEQANVDIEDLRRSSVV